MRSLSRPHRPIESNSESMSALLLWPPVLPLVFADEDLGVIHMPEYEASAAHQEAYEGLCLFQGLE